MNQEKKRVQTLQVDSARVLSKVVPVCAQLKELFGNKSYPQTPKDGRKQAEAAKRELDKFMGAAEDRVRGNNSEAFSFTLEDVSAAVKNGTFLTKHKLQQLHTNKHIITILNIYI